MGRRPQLFAANVAQIQYHRNGENHHNQVQNVGKNRNPSFLQEEGQITLEEQEEQKKPPRFSDIFRNRLGGGE